EELRDLFSRLALSVLFVTHDQDEAFGLGDRVAVMDAGRILQIGSPTEVWRAPVDATVARFLGWNVLTDPDDRGDEVDRDGTRLAVAPDRLLIADHGQGWPGVVVAATFRRDHFRVKVVLDATGDTLDLVTRDAAPAVGDRVGVVPESAAVRYLPI